VYLRLKGNKTQSSVQLAPDGWFGGDAGGGDFGGDDGGGSSSGF
jgi:hypothetical protein